MPIPPPEIPDVERPLTGLRVGWSDTGGAAPVHPEVKTAVKNAALRLEKLGCHVEAARIPALEERDWNKLSMTLYAAEAGAYLAPIIAGRQHQLHPFLQRRLSFTVNSLDDYLAALADWETLKQDVAHYFTRYDLLLCPCVPLPAHPHNAGELTINGQVVPARHVLRVTVPWDLTGSPALAVPYAWSADSLPIAVQLVGRHFDDATVLAVGMALETASDVTGKQPPL